MAYTKKIKAGLVKLDYTQFVGEDGTLFYNADNGTLRISDGVTPGGQPVNLIGTFEDIAIGNLVVDGTTIKPNTPNTNLNLEGTGTGVLHLTTPLHVAKITSTGDTVMSIKDDGQVKIMVATVDSVEGALAIVGNLTGTQVAPQNTGVMLHITGQQDDPSRIYLDSVGERAVIAGRRYNGTSTAPTAVLNNQVIARYGGTPYTSAGWPALTTTRIDFVANEDQTGTAQGNRIEFWATPGGSVTPARQAYCDGTGLNATNITTSGLLNVTNQNIVGSTPVLTVSANADGLTKVPGLAGTIAQFTAKDGARSFIVQDTYGPVGGSMFGGEYTFRTARGTNASPSAVLADDILGCVGGAGWGTTGFGGIFASCLEFRAAENFTDTARGGKAVFKLIPAGSITQVNALTITPTAVTMAPNAQLEGRVALTAGTTSAAPLTFTAGDLLTTPVAGTVCYDGRAFYAVPQDSERGIIPVEQLFVANATRNLTAGVTTAQSIFGKTVHVSANTRYHYVMKFTVLKNGSGSNAPTINYGIATNGATLFSHSYQAITTSGTSGGAVSEVKASNAMTNYITTNFATGVPITAAMGVSVAYANIEVRGWINVDQAGTLDFQIAFSAAPNTSASVQPSASVRIYPVSAAGADTSIGTWA